MESERLQRRERGFPSEECSSPGVHLFVGRNLGSWTRTLGYFIIFRLRSRNPRTEQEGALLLVPQARFRKADYWGGSRKSNKFLGSSKSRIIECSECYGWWVLYNPLYMLKSSPCKSILNSLHRIFSWFRIPWILLCYTFRIFNSKSLQYLRPRNSPRDLRVPFITYRFNTTDLWK